MVTKKDIYSSKLIIVIICGYIIYLALAQFSEYWLGIITNHDIGEDFHIYYNAYIKAVSGENPYFPYDIGNSFVNHPFVLTFLSLFSWHKEKFLATFFWVITSALAWVFVIWLVFHLVWAGIADYTVKDVNLNQYLGWALATFLGFAPFWETIHIGQINIFVILFLCLMFYFFEQDKSVLSGFFLALAIALKTSPVIFVIYYIFLRKYSLLTSCAVSLVVLSLIPSIQFSSSVLTNFLTILPELSSEIHPTSYNQSVLSLSFRVFSKFGLEDMESILIISHKIAMIGILGVILLLVLVRSSTKMSRLWEFALLSVIMTLFSPLVWYHHSVFLILPLLILLLYSNHRYVVIGIGIIFVIQFERLFEYKITNFAWPISLAGFLLLGLGIWIYYSDWRSW